MYSWAARVVLAVAACTLAFAVLETGLRLTVDGETLVRRPWMAEEIAYVEHPFLPFAGRPNLEQRYACPSGTGATCVVRNNAYGFRTHEFPAEKTDADFFVICLGGSTTWGAAAETNAETWPEQLERLLQARHPGRRVRVFNFGTTLANSTYSIVTLALMGLQLRPDLVIVYHGVNDSGPMSSPSYRTDLTHHFRDLDLEHTWRGIHAVLPAWMLRSYVVAFVASRLDDRAGTTHLTRYTTHPLSEARVSGELAASRVVANLATIGSIASSVGAKTIYSTFQFREKNDEFRPALNDAIRRYCEQTGSLCVDLDAAIPDGRDDLQFDACHFTRAGRELVAATFATFIEESGLLPD